MYRKWKEKQKQREVCIYFLTVLFFGFFFSPPHCFCEYVYSLVLFSFLWQEEETAEIITKKFVRNILEGDIQVCEKASKKALRVFVSSTFTDTKPERNYLMRETYPSIRAYCEQRGVRFRLVYVYYI